MKKINLAEFVSEKYGRELSDENKSAILIEQKLRGILDRAGPHIREIDFNHSWPVISQTILENIKEKCFQLTKLEMGWVRINADISPLLEHVAPQLEEFSLEESSWIGENARQNEAKVAQYFPKMHNLRRLNLRKFGGPLDDLVKIEGKLE
uniref:DHC_N2 domain-containing protein n=1 Tax=Meloidogyne hapla TaxID=6305 RepID=A0A1I8C2V3_MELHA